MLGCKLVGKQTIRNESRKKTALRSIKYWLFTLPPIIMEVNKWVPPIVVTFQTPPFSTSMIMGERAILGN